MTEDEMVGLHPALGGGAWGWGPVVVALWAPVGREML